MLLDRTVNVANHFSPPLTTYLIRTQYDSRLYAVESRFIPVLL